MGDGSEQHHILHINPTKARARRRFFKGVLRATMKSVLKKNPPMGFQRAWTRAVLKSVAKPSSVTVDVRRVNGRTVHVLTPPNADPDEGILFLHGGAYVIGGDGAYVGYAGQIARATRRRVWLPDYRLAPEHAYPAAVEDALATFDAMVNEGFNQEDITLLGDSAGGGLSAATALALKARDGDDAAGALVLMSPWTDLTMSGESVERLASRDPLIDPAWGRASRMGYAGNRPLDDPGLSPLFARLEGLPRTLIQTGSEEVLLSDTLRFADALNAAGVPVQCEIYDDLWHDFQMQVGLVADATRAVNRIRVFLDRDD
ncbi:alpha/beta hydrolase [uncultured Abyssibacter sp.]|uniref:alpha/beta hydrolase n=1 Tax=uncultured Abyssibacter sp. TaxID=2320202 RepID=UPI0032B1D304